MAELDTLAIVAFTAALTAVEVHRWLRARQERRLERMQRKIDLAFTIGMWDWPTIVQGGKSLVLEAARDFAELTSVLDFPGDNVIENDVRNLLNGLASLLRGSHGVDRSKEVEQIKERIGWGVMGWVEESERLRRSPWLA